MWPIFCILRGLFSQPLKHRPFWAHILWCAMCSFSVSFLRVSQECFLVFSYLPFFGFLLSQTSVISVILIMGIWVPSLQTCLLMLPLYLLLHSLSHTHFCVFLPDEVSHVAQASPLAPLLPLPHSPSILVLFVTHTHFVYLPFSSLFSLWCLMLYLFLFSFFLA